MAKQRYMTQELLGTIKDLVFCLENGSDGFSLGDYQTLEENVLANANKILEEVDLPDHTTT
jgi:hypothetical protein